MQLLTSTAKDTKISLAVIIISSVISLTSFFYYLHIGYILLYSDAASHLVIARRVTDSLTPGVAQLGDVWLPLQHVLAIPFIWNNFLWHSGIGGSIVSMISFVLTAFFLFKTAKLLTNNYFSGLIAALVIVTNANYLYIQTTFMTESLMLATMSSYLYFLLKWSKSNNISDLLIAAFCVFLSTLTRYEAWFLALFGIGYVFYAAYRRKTFRYSESMTIIYTTLAFFGIFLWILYGYIILGNGFYFLNGPFSAKAQQETIYLAGALPTKNNILITVQTYFWNLIDTVGMGIFAATVISFGLYILNKPKKENITYLFVTFGPPFVIILTLFLGITAIYIPQIPINDHYNNLFNVRYGLMSLPFVALILSLLANTKKQSAVILLSFIIILQSLYLYANDYVLTLNNAVEENNITHAPSMQMASVLFNDCRNGLTLMSAAGFDPLLIKTNIDPKHFIYEGNYGYWQTSLRNPTVYADCVVMGTLDEQSDVVRASLYKNPMLLNNYTLLFQNSMGLILKKTKELN
ncbi:MAG TPA: glycosyltransferase family 39 protein [Candidatus Saccharimonadales bacterium]|nr:glycosyltransferase family 39 protein [Candidatus Saccharimonadales bacterium]